MKPTKIYNVTLPANGSLRLLIEGEYFKILACAGAVSVRADWGELAGIGAGQGLESSPFKYLLLTDLSGGLNAVRLVIGDEKFIDGSSGAVEVSKNRIAQSGVFGSTAKTVTNASGLLVPANANRQYLLIQNNDGAGYIAVQFGAAATLAAGLKIIQGGNYELSSIVPTGEIYAIGSAANNPNVVVVEG